ncbi:MAG: GspH/FimT family pseudopilin [Proteobacteria bacterium]|nr:GspH/FimT family pseudopilin [Pseudomonadota bacterium]
MISRPTAQRGTTPIEACVALAVAAIVAGAAAPSLQNVIDARRLDGAAAQLATDIQYTRTLAVARSEPVRLTVQTITGGSCYVVHTGNAGQCPCSAGGATACTGGARALKTVQLAASDHVTLQSNAGSILFDPLHGTSSPTATLRIVGTGDRAIHHVVNVMGRVRSCSPLAAVPGYRAC